MSLDFDSRVLLFYSINPVSKKTYSSLAAVLVMSVAFAGCFAWNYVKEGYDDFSAYFNTYYNASLAYENGLKDVEATKQAYDLDLISGNHPPAFVISNNAKQDFDIAIAKASKVLQLHPKSEFTEDCLFMIGISYYYEGDNIRGERKFLEIEATFPNTKRLAEAEMYYGAFQLSGKDNETGRDRLLNAIQIARNEKSDKIVSMSCDILSDYYLEGGDTVTAAAYLDTASVFSSGDKAAIYACRAGNLYTGLKEYARALTDYARAKEAARDIKIRFYSVYYLARVHRLMAKYYLALGNLNELRTDDKYFDFFPLIDYQEAATLYDSGSVSKAVTAFQKIDTAYATSEAATRSAYKLANIYLYVVGDFQTALKYYQKVGSHPKVYAISDDGQQMAATLQSYLVSGYKVLLNDSLYYRAETAIERHDTTVNYTPAMLDTLYEHAAEARQELAGMYMFKLQMPDSALRSYKIILTDFSKSKVYPSTLFTLGDYYYSAGDTAKARTYLEELLTQYPGSSYSASASTLLGIPAPVYVDSSQVEYSTAVSLTNDRNYPAAVDTLKRLVSDRKSALAPQALYMIGWIYENHLDLPDSAYAYYKQLSLQFPASTFSSTVTLALSGYEMAQRDSALAKKHRSDSISAALNAKDKIDSIGRGGEQLQTPEQKLDSAGRPHEHLRVLGERIDSARIPVGVPKDSARIGGRPDKEVIRRGR